MSKKVEQVKHTLELDEHIKLHQKGWVVQHIGWIVMIVFILLAAFGLFGDGVLSKKTVQAQHITAMYERFFRYEAEMPIEVKLKSTTESSVISFSNDYLHRFDIIRIIPEPKENYIKAGHTFYVFNTREDATITFFLKPESWGYFSGTMKINQSNIQITHFIYP